MWHIFRSPVADRGDPNELGPDEWNNRHAERCFPNVVLVAGSKALLFSSLPDLFGDGVYNANEPNTDYAINITGNVDENFFWSNKAMTGFTVNSSNSASTATVDVRISRRS
jgi:hypothetical protein